MPLRCFLYIGLAIALLGGCGRSFTPADEAAVRTVMQEQQAAWDRGDILAFMDGYADSVCFISAKGRTCGKAEVTDHYRKAYPDQTAMGRLHFGGLEVLGAGADNAWCTGTWQLFRAQDTLGGGFSLFWQRTPAGWRIVRDHTY